MDIDVIYKDENLIVLNKPAGILVHGDNKTEEDTLIDWLEINCPETAGVGDSPEERPGIVHRLDRDTSGIILVARNQEYFEYLKSLFKNREIHKTYRAIVLNPFKEERGVIDAPISIKAGSIKRTAHKGKDSKEAVTEYKVLKNFDNFSYVEAYPKTGRTHQIRVHFNSIGHPVAGDKLYGGKSAVGATDRQMLHAYSLELALRPGETVKLTADLPDDFIKFLASLEK
ncbi:RluA family pseudouridine synthase [Patescibacteria group bacterium]|nr:RluA family pseudouridine synthase [Patescibacteria group bacterium]